MKLITRSVLLFSLLATSISINAQVKKKYPVKKSNTTKKLVAKPKSVTAAIKPVVLDTSVRIKLITEMGEIVLKLYDKTPLHRDNFIKLVNEHFYDSLLFHRVINSFMIQGGDPKSKTAASGEMLGMGDVGYTIPAEFDSNFYHKKGALCAARTNNPAKASSGCQFYIVQGRKYSDAEITSMLMQNGSAYSSAKRMTYKMNGGTPFLDMEYTVFGEVEKGMDVIDRIAIAPIDGNNRPLTDIKMSMEVVLQNKK